MTIFESNLDVVNDGLGLFKGSAVNPAFYSEIPPPEDLNLEFLDPSMFLQTHDGNIKSNAFRYLNSSRGDMMVDVSFKLDPRKAIVEGLEPVTPSRDKMGVNYILIIFNSSSNEAEKYGVDLSALDMDDNGNFHIGVGGSMTVYSDRCNIRLPKWLLFKAKIFMRQFLKQNPQS
jgi:hypothetical protein